MIDLHSHILPNVDDGAQSLGVALAMLDEYHRMGYSTVVATPHWSYPSDEKHQALIQSTLNELRPYAERSGIKLLLGRECMLPPDHTPLCVDLGLSLNGSRFLLVELPFSSRPLFMEESMFGIQASGKTVILAHPERYRFIQENLELAAALVDRGVLLQINIGSLSGRFGKSARNAAEHLLRNGLVHVAATDAHSDGARLQSVTPSLKILSNIVGDDGCQHLVQHNPALVLANIIPEPVRPRFDHPSILNRWFGRFLP